MNTYEILTKNSNVLALNQLSQTFSEEVSQLLQQGYKAVDVIKACSTVEALNLHKQSVKPCVSGKTVAKVVAGVIVGLWCLGFVNGLGAISSQKCADLEGNPFGEVLVAMVDTMAERDNSLPIYKQGKTAGVKFSINNCVGN